MRIAFRTDASLQIGTGHVMRCLTLADALRERGAKCNFVCRPHAGHLHELIKERGHEVLALPALQEIVSPYKGLTVHDDWLGIHWTTDADDTHKALNAEIGYELFDWLIVDHYALDQRWEKALRANAKRIMVIDDLADRTHACSILLDQTFGRSELDYRHLVPGDCRLLCGSQFALLRPEFADLREYSLKRRNGMSFRRLLISMGGVDKDNATEMVLQALRSCSLPLDCRIAVVMGSTAPWLDEIRNLAKDMPWPTEVLVGVNNMAEIMADSDLAIGAAGASSWERCCLGLPTAMLILAENQKYAATQLEQTNAVRILQLSNNFEACLSEFIDEIVHSASSLERMQDAASKLTEGNGCESIIDYILK